MSDNNIPIGSGNIANFLKITRASLNNPSRPFSPNITGIYYFIYLDRPELSNRLRESLTRPSTGLSYN